MSIALKIFFLISTLVIFFTFKTYSNDCSEMLVSSQSDIENFDVFYVEPTVVDNPVMLTYFQKLIDHKVTTKSLGLDLFPDSSKLLSTALTESESTQDASLKNPRILNFDPINSIVGAFNQSAEQKGSYAIEVLTSDTSGNLQYLEVVFKEDYINHNRLNGNQRDLSELWTKENLEFIEDEVYYFDDNLLISNPNPNKCLRCHFALVDGKKVPGIIWEKYPKWEKAIASHDDALYLPYEVDMIERLYGQSGTLSELGFTMPVYRTFDGNGFMGRKYAEMPNTQLTFLLSNMLAESFLTNQLVNNNLNEYSLIYLYLFDEYQLRLLIGEKFPKFNSIEYINKELSLYNLNVKVKTAKRKHSFINVNSYNIGGTLYVRPSGRPYNSLLSLVHHIAIKKTLKSDSILSKYSQETGYLREDLETEYFYKYDTENPREAAIMEYYLGNSLLPPVADNITPEDLLYLKSKVIEETKKYIDSFE